MPCLHEECEELGSRSFPSGLIASDPRLMQSTAWGSRPHRGADHGAPQRKHVGMRATHFGTEFHRIRRGAADSGGEPCRAPSQPGERRRCGAVPHLQRSSFHISQTPDAPILGQRLAAPNQLLCKHSETS